MDKDKQARLEAKGWRFGDADEFLGADAGQCEFVACEEKRMNTMTLNELQENLKRKGYTSEEIDIWTAGHQSGGNYTANDSTFPTEITFQNGRKVGIAFDGDKPYLTVGIVE